MNLFHRLFTYLMFAGTTFFAAGAPPITGGTSTSSSGGTAAPLTGTTGGDSTPDGSHDTSGGSDALKIGGESTDDASGSEVDAGIDDFGSFGDDDFGEVEEVEARQAPSNDEFGPETYQKLKSALKTDPVLFKSVKKGLSMLKRFSEHFETPEKAGELLGKLQTMGGVEGIEQELGETATFLNGWNASDPQVIGKWLEENGDGLPGAMPTIMDQWRKVDQSGWAHDAAQTFIATLNDAPVGGISALAAFNELAKIEGVKDSEAYKRIQQVLQAVQQTAERAPEKKAVVNDDKLSARERKVQEQEREMRKQSLGGKAQPILTGAANSALKTVIGARKLSPEHTKQLISDIQREFATLAAADENAAKNRKALLAAGQDEQWLKQVKSAADRHMVTAARRVWRKYTGIAGLSTQQKETRKADGQSRREAGAGASQGSLKTESPGDGRQVDRQRMIQELGSKDKADDAFMFGIPGKFGGKRFWFKKGVKDVVFTY